MTVKEAAPEPSARPPRVLRCASCKTRDCRAGKDCHNDAARHMSLYNVPRLAKMHAAATAIEARHYCKEPRLRELVLFAKEMEYERLGLAFCAGLGSEAQVIADVLSRDFEVVSVCCKVCGIEKKSLGLERISRHDTHETMCNPAGQATLLNEAHTELNILCGLCVGHDAIFGMVSRAPVTTFAVKDHVLGHNPLAAVYSEYIRDRLLANGHQMPG